jgi:SynChlorMet cassette radical SAM/SPASM protein ScmF
MVAPTAPQTPPLDQLYVYVTDRCNCRCRHCWIVPQQAGAGQAAGHFLAPESFAAAVEEGVPLGLSSVKWTGGEPTIHPQFPRLLAIQKEHGLAGRLETNGMELTASLARLLFATGVKYVSVSIDGARPETHDAIRGVQGGYRRTLRGVAHLVEAGFRPQLIMSLMRENVGELEDFLALADRAGAGSVKLNIIQPTLRGEEMHAAGGALPVAALLEINRRVERELRARHAFEIFFDLPMAFRSIQRMLSKGCPACGIKTILGLLADGRYALCGIGTSVPELVFGAAGVGALAGIWKDQPVLQQIRHGLPGSLKGVCGRCLMAAACLGACVAQNYYRSRDLMGAYWFCEAAERDGLFPVSRLSPKLDPSASDLPDIANVPS